MSKVKNWLNILSTPMGKVFFKNKPWQTSNFLTRGTRITATMKGQHVGEMVIESSLKHGGEKYSWVKDTNVIESMRGLGVSSGLFKQSLKKSSSYGSEFLRTQEILHPAQVSIREKYKTKFMGYGLGKYGEGEELITPSRARLTIISNQKYGRYIGSVRATTKIPKNINKTPKIDTSKYNVRFVRIRGKIVPIRNKK